MSLATRLVAQWYRPGLTPLTAALTPLAAVFGTLAALRRSLYRAGWLRVTRLPVPVIVVGNIAVGGTGKTPLTGALAALLQNRGWKPGIVSRGHGGSAAAAREVREVRADDDAAVVGDEPLLLAGGSAPVAIGRDRVAAARHLLSRHPQIDVIVADDGLQHYALARDVELVVIDAGRRFGNGWLLPAGPLREPQRRAARAHARVFAVTRESDAAVLPPGSFAMVLAGESWQPLVPGTPLPDLAALPADTVHAVAGIGNPERFFAELAARGIHALTHAFPDHHPYTAHDLAFPGARAILMTAKDAVKCRAFADARMYFLPLSAIVDPALVALIEDTLHGSQAARAPGLPGHQGPAHI